jgi:threonine aldolase
MIDLRSDTVTRPTLAMRQAMANAEVGDDMMGEDPTVRRLEALMAELFGHEAAVFACSGTQCNQIAVHLHCLPGDELLIHETGHIANFETGAPAVLSGVTTRTISGIGGKLDLADLDGKVRIDDQHYPRTRLLCLENTTNIGGGCVYGLSHLERLSEWALEHSLRRHLDGARIFNATIAGGYTPADVGRCFDTISVCFSKGLGCPMGSILIGTAQDMKRARRVRKMLGGSLRQAGIVAAAALYAMEHHVHRLRDDHHHAQQLAEGLSGISGITVSGMPIESNLLFFHVDPNLGTAVQFAAAMRDHGVLVGPMGGQRLRAVTHLDVAPDDIPQVLAAAADCIRTGFRDKALTGSGPYSR